MTLCPFVFDLLGVASFSCCLKRHEASAKDMGLMVCPADSKLLRHAVKGMESEKSLFQLFFIAWRFIT
jgi:hypothetical protein